MHLDSQFDVIIPQIVDMMLGVLLKGNAGHEEQVRRIASEEMTTAFTLHRKEMIDVTRDTYRRNFNDAELGDLTAFYQSPTGQKFIARQSQIVRQSMAGGAAVGQAAAREALPRIIERMKALNLSVPKGA